jgi:hypothetical protein
MALVLITGCGTTPKSLVDKHLSYLKDRKISTAEKQLCSKEHSRNGGVIPIESFKLQPPRTKLNGSLTYHEATATVKTAVKQAGSPNKIEYEDPFSGSVYRKTVTLQDGTTREMQQTYPKRSTFKTEYPEAPITQITVEIWKSDDFYDRLVQQQQIEQKTIRSRWQEEKAQNLAKYRTPHTAAQWDRTYAGGPPKIKLAQRTDVSAEPFCIAYTTNWSHSVLGEFKHPTKIQVSPYLNIK